MAPTSLHALLPRGDASGASLGELFHHFPAIIWRICKMLILGFAIILALCGIGFGIYCLFMAICICVPRLSQWLMSGKWREDVEGWREKTVGRLWRIERVDRVWKWMERRGARWKAEDVDAEELEHLGSGNGEGSVGGETLFEGEEDDDDNEGGQARRKKEDMEPDTKD